MARRDRAYLLPGPGSYNAARPHGADAGNLTQAIRLCLDDVGHVLAESAWQLLGADRAYASNHFRCKIPFGSLNRGGCGRLKKLGLELLVIGRVIKPFARRSDPLTNRYGGAMANHGDKFSVTTNLRPDDSKLFSAF